MVRDMIEEGLMVTRVALADGPIRVQRCFHKKQVAAACSPLLDELEARTK